MPFLLASADLPGAAVVDLAVAFAGMAVEAVCEKVMPVKNTSMIKVNKIPNTVFIVFCFYE
jgi:hypothetical protein